MKDSTIARAILIGSCLIAVSIVIGGFIISRAPRFEKTGSLELIDTRSGTIYSQTGSMGKGRPNYNVVRGPKSGGATLREQ